MQVITIYIYSLYLSIYIYTHTCFFSDSACYGGVPLNEFTGNVRVSRTDRKCCHCHQLNIAKRLIYINHISNVVETINWLRSWLSWLKLTSLLPSEYAADNLAVFGRACHDSESGPGTPTHCWIRRIRFEKRLDHVVISTNEFTTESIGFCMLYLFL